MSRHSINDGPGVRSAANLRVRRLHSGVSSTPDHKEDRTSALDDHAWTSHYAPWTDPHPDTVTDTLVSLFNQAVNMPDGEPGELLARGPQVFSSYLNNPEANERAFHDGWFRTGDMAVMEPDGWIKLVSRIKEMIITGGFNVYPDEVEGVMRSHPDVEDIAVVGRPRADGSEDVVACVTLVGGRCATPSSHFLRNRRFGVG